MTMNKSSWDHFGVEVWKGLNEYIIGFFFIISGNLGGRNQPLAGDWAIEIVYTPRVVGSIGLPTWTNLIAQWL